MAGADIVNNRDPLRNEVEFKKGAMPPLSGRSIPDEQFGQLFAEFETSAWRLELLPQYLVAFEKERFDAFLKGEPFPPHPKGEWWKIHEDWVNTIKSIVGQGKTIGRVHVMPPVLTPYLRFEIEWGYLFNAAAGDDIRILSTAHLNEEMKKCFLQDFWMFDDQKVVLCDYGPNGSWMGGRILDDPSQLPVLLRARELAIGNSIPLREFLAAYRSGIWR